MIIRKRKQEKKELNRRLEEASQKYEAARGDLKIVLDKKENQTDNLLAEICLSKELSRNKQKQEEYEKRQLVQKALEEVQKREKELSQQLMEVQVDKIKRAEEKVEKEKIEKKVRAEEERISRENRALEKLRESKKREEEKTNEKRKVIERKIKRVR